MRKERSVVSTVKAALLAAALLAGVATDAFAAGTISGRVTGSDTVVGLPDTVVQFYDLNRDIDIVPSATTDALGFYTSPILQAGTYGVLTQDTHGYINEIWNNISCSAVCDVNSLTAIDITDTDIAGIDFVLNPGGRIAGTITDSGTGLPIANIKVFFVDENGELTFTSAISDASGNYISDGGTVTGNVFAVTANSLGYRNEVYTNGAGNPYCPDCDPTADGAPIAVTVRVTTNGINFVLDPGGRISGNVTDGSAPLEGIEVNAYDSTGNRVDETVTDASGNYSTAGLPAGTYYVGTDNSLGFVDELYNNITCPGGFCNPTNGTPISVTVPSTTSGINFALAAGGTVTGTVTAAAGGASIQNVNISFFNTSGTFVGGTNSDSSGGYSIFLPGGTYYARTFNAPGFQDQLYDHIACGSGCNVTTGTGISVTVSQTTGNINFELVTGGTVTGTVTRTDTTTVGNFQIQLYSSGGSFLTSVNTDGSGVYTFSGLAAASYYVRTNGTNGFLINQLYNGVTCVGCSVTSSGGTLIAVTAGNTTGGINFVLANGGLISGTVTKAIDGQPVPPMQVQILSSTGTFLVSFSTNASGQYSTSGLPAGTYFARTANGGHLVNKLYNDITCNPCNITSGTPIAVTAGNTMSGINFSLALGGAISGTITNASGGAPIQNVQVQLYNSSGQNLGGFNTDASGNYTTQGFPVGTYYSHTRNPSGFVDELYDNLPCTFGSCNQTVTSGTPITITLGTTTTGKNFALALGGRISGKVSNASGGAGIQFVSVQVYNAAGVFLGSVNTDAAGNYTTNGLPAGTYYSKTSNTAGFIDELYDNLPCTLGNCSQSVTSGTPISVTVGVTTSNINHALVQGGRISGTVTNTSGGGGIQFIQVQIHTAAGALLGSAFSENAGNYTTGGVPAGTYYSSTSNNSGFVDELYDNIPCPNFSCTVTSGTAIMVNAGATTTGINYGLVQGGRVSGTVTDAAGGAGIPTVYVQFFNAAGTFTAAQPTDAMGNYLSRGVPAGTYYISTNNGRGFLDKLYNNMPCPYFNCTVTNGTAVTVNAGFVTSPIDFALDAAVFTDDPLTVGVTVIKAVHITELRQRIEAVRGRFGLYGSYAWTDLTITAGVTVIKAQHILELRTALSEAYVAAALTPPTYTDPGLAAGMTIKRVHIAELRAAVIVIE